MTNKSNAGRPLRLSALMLRAWRLARTRALWAWRMNHLGRRSVVGRCRLAPNPGSIWIGDHTVLSDGWTLADLKPEEAQATPRIRIGSHCTILHDFQCNAGVSVEIQDHVLIAPRVFVTDSDHIFGQNEHPTESCEYRSAPVVIEHDCWLGVNAVILKGVTLGHHSIVGAGAVVARSFPAFSTVTGVPARARECQAA